MRCEICLRRIIESRLGEYVLLTRLALHATSLSVSIQLSSNRELAGEIYFLPPKLLLFFGGGGKAKIDASVKLRRRPWSLFNEPASLNFSASPFPSDMLACITLQTFFRAILLGCSNYKEDIITFMECARS